MAIVPAGVYLRLDEVPGVARGIKKMGKSLFKPLLPPGNPSGFSQKCSWTAIVTINVRRAL